MLVHQFAQCSQVDKNTIQNAILYWQSCDTCLYMVVMNLCSVCMHFTNNTLNTYTCFDYLTRFVTHLCAAAIGNMEKVKKRKRVYVYSIRRIWIFKWK